MGEGWLLAIGVAGCLGAGCAGRYSELPPPAEIEEILLAAVPEYWSLAESREGQGPPGHGSVDRSGRQFVLLGPGPVAFQWKDEAGQWHNEELAREALELWVMPGSYRPSLRRFFEHHGHLPPKRIYASDRLRVYAQVSHRIVNEDRFSELLRTARSTSWSDIADKSCTWTDWAEEVSESFRVHYG